MPKQEAGLDGVFHALADPTRRAVVVRLGVGACSTTELAEPFEMALPSFLQHLGVLERSGLVRSRKQGRVRTWELEPRGMEVAEGWLSARRREWEDRLDRLDDYLRRLADGSGTPAARGKGRPS